MKNNIIPIVHCFDNNYAIAASVAFYSMLKNANPNYTYNLYVLHNDITEENQKKLNETISDFKNSNLEFIYMKDRFSNLFKDTVSKAHYSKEIYYKFIIPSLFEQYEKIIVTDVDVIYKGDISKSFIEFNIDDDYYIAGVKSPIKKDSFLETYFKETYNNFTDEELSKLEIGAGYMIYNLSKMRKDNIEQKLIEYAENNINRIMQPEQDCLNLVCYPKIKILNPSNLVCSYLYDLYKTKDDYKTDLVYPKETIENLLKNPIQLHYACNKKPWNSICQKYEEWFRYLTYSPFLEDFLEKYYRKLQDPPPKEKGIVFIQNTFFKKKAYVN